MAYSSNTTTLLMLHAPQLWRMKISQLQPTTHFVSSVNAQPLRRSEDQFQPLRRTKSMTFDPYDHYDDPQFTMDDDDGPSF